MIIDMYNLGKAFVDSGGGSGGSGLTKQQQRLSLLTENHQVGTPLFMLYLDESGTARLEMQEVQEGHSYRLPFIKVAPNAAYLTPVFKADVKKGLKASKRNTTLNSFRQLAEAKRPSAPYFRRIVETLTATKLRIAGEPAAVKVSDAFTATVDQIVAAKPSGRSPLIGIASDDKGNVWPGDDERFVAWILNARQRISIYETNAVPNGERGICPLSGEEGELFSNGLAGAGLNLVNGDFQGSFSEHSSGRAWQRAAISSTAADMLYIYKNHVAPEFFEYIGGSKALVIPASSADNSSRASFVKGVRQLVESQSNVRKENRLLKKLAQNDASVASISLLWADFGQKFEEARGLITHVLPSRLAELERIHAEYEKSPHLFHPQHGDFTNVRRPLNLNFSLIADLIYRPGGARVKDENASPRRHNVLRATVAAIYHRQSMEPNALWKEIAQTARAYVVLLLEQSESKGVVYQLRFEGPNQPKKQMPLTVNGWIRHLTSRGHSAHSMTTRNETNTLEDLAMPLGAKFFARISFNDVPRERRHRFNSPIALSAASVIIRVPEFPAACARRQQEPLAKVFAFGGES